MLNEERIKLMTKMAAYEEHEGRKYLSIGSYFRGDYIGLQVIKAIISATLAFGVIFGMYVLYDFEVFMQDIYNMDILQFAKTVLLYYFVFVIGYSVISYVIYSVRYNRAKKSLKRFFYNLKQLSSLYDAENKK